MSLKDNFNQALKEILKKDGIVGDDLSKDSKKKSELDRYLDRANESDGNNSFRQTAEPAKPSVAESNSFTGNVNKTTSANSDVKEQSPLNNNANTFKGNNDTPSFSQTQNTAGSAQKPFGFVPPPAPQKTPSPEPSPSDMSPNPSDPTYYETEETTVISRNTIIDGNIRSFANISIDGSVKGDVSITKNINVTGKVVGDIQCNNSTMVGASMQGNIASKGQVQMDRDSLLLGDISSQYLDLNGKIKGNIEVGGKAEFKTDAIILGNITASTITVLDGATIQGYVNTTFLQENTSNIFPEAIAVSE